MNEKVNVQRQTEPILLKDITHTYHGDQVFVFTQTNNNQLDEETAVQDSWSFWHFLREMMELMLGLVLVSIGSYFLPPAWATSHLIFCLYFFLAFAVALRYTWPTAYLAAVCSAAGYCLLSTVHGLIDLQHFNLTQLTEPFFLLVTGVITSDLLGGQRRRFWAAEKHMQELQQRYDKVNRRYQKALTVNAELEKRISGQGASIALICDKMTQLWKVRGNERYDAILEIISDAVEANSCALYMWRDKKMYLYASLPAQSQQPSPMLDLNDPLIERVLQQRRVSTVRDALVEGARSDQMMAVMAGPLIDAGEHVVGIVIVNNMPLLKFTPNAARLFSSLLHLASISLQTTLPVPKEGQGQYLNWRDDDETEPALPALMRFRKPTK